jgi:GGDEF domain-containing protein
VAPSRSSRARRFALPDHGDDDRTVESIEAFLDGPEVRRHRPPIRRPRKGYPNTGSQNGTAPKNTGSANGTTAPGAGSDPKAATNGNVSANGKAGANGKAEANGKAVASGTPEANGTADKAPKSSEAPTNGASPSASTAVVNAPQSTATTYQARPATDIRTIPGRLEFNTALERESLRAGRYGRPAAVAIVELVPVRVNQAIDIWLRSLAGAVSRTLRQGTRATDLVARVANARFQVLLPETPETGAGLFAERVTTACQSSIDESGAPVSVRVTIAAATPEHSLHEALNNALQSIEAA